MSTKNHEVTMRMDAVVQEEMQREAARLDRSLSYMAQLAWKLARHRLRALPAETDATGDGHDQTE